jgi:GT2 family glycosyltransferase
VDGKFLRVDGERFYVRGVTYGPFAETELGMFPKRERLEKDFAAIAAVGINTLRTYMLPAPGVLDLAEEAGLKLLMGGWDIYWKWGGYPEYLELTADQEGLEKMTVESRAMVKKTIDTYAGHPAVLGFVLGNEIPGPLVRWYGRRRVQGLLRSLYETAKEVAPDALFGYANYPTTQYLDTSFFDFDCFNVFLEDESAYRHYLAQLQIMAGDRPLVLTEVGLNSGNSGIGEEHQARSLDWQLRVAAELGIAGTCVFSWTDEWWAHGEKVEGWYFGITRENREPKPALKVVEDHYRKKPSDIREKWPKVSVVVCAYQAEDTVGECLQSLVELDYPDYEVVVVDDGSTDTTAEIARNFPVRLLSGVRIGLAGARNLGLEHAEGEIVAYIDADAYADPDWLTYLVFALEAPEVAGAGGPNPGPPNDPPTAQCVARAPGGPIHVLIDDERAEHVPGCNMAFWRERLLEIGGFDPVYRAAGDDVDVCWKLMDLGYEIRFHPSAVVWHRRRDSIRAFWRQQVNYGKAEALVEQKHPDKFNALGQAIWRGVVYGSTSVLPGRARLYCGRFGGAPFQRLYQPQNHFNPLPILFLILGLLLPALLNLYLLTLPLAGLMVLTTAYVVHGVRVARSEGLRPTWRLGTLLGLLHLLPPVARAWGRLRARRRSTFLRPECYHWPIQRIGQRLFVTESVEEGSKDAFLEAIRSRLRTTYVRPKLPSVWDESDITCDSVLFWRIQMVCYEIWGMFYVRLYRRLRPTCLLVLLGATLVLLWSPLAGAGALVTLVAILPFEGWLFERRVRRALVGEVRGPAVKEVR